MSEKPVHIYAARSKTTGKVYIGLTVSLSHRKSGHKHSATINRQTYFYNAIRRYGWDDFEWCIIETLATRSVANEVERYWINYFKSNSNSYGYNMTEGGDGGATITGRYHSLETRQKIANSNRGKPLSEDRKRKISESHRGKTMSEESRKKMSESHRGRRNSDESINKAADSNRGRVHTEESRQNMRDGWRRRLERLANES